MYLSRLRIKNYRSIEELDITFEKGKNVIIGRNNSGKSNILRAIDIVLGETFPAYHKTQNIVENDFHNGEGEEPIYIFCELLREPGEKLNYKEMYRNCFGFFVHGRYEQSHRDREFGVNYIEGAPFQHDIGENNFWEDLERLFSISKDHPLGTSYYINSKARSFSPYEKEFEDKYSYSFAFKAKIEQSGRIVKDIRFLYRADDTSPWTLCFTAPIRTEFLQSAIIPAFRDPDRQLRIANYTWYGKLLRYFTAQKYEQLREAFEAVKEVSQEVFSPLVQDINDTHTCVAFPNTTISFECTPDSKDDIELIPILSQS